MSSLLKKLFGPKRQPLPELAHPVLGTLSYDAESEHWGKRVAVAGQEFVLSVGGDYEPDPALLDQAARVHADLGTLVADLAVFLEAEAAGAPEQASEIRSLKLEELAVWWPKQPDAVMVWFHGPSEERIWHCSYTKGKLSDLVYDC